jgi:probable HAF family extracellular repeat protein
MKRALCGWAVLAAALAIGMTQLSAQLQTTYNVLTLPTLGGAAGQANSINNRGWASGLADFAGDGIGHAALWVNSSRLIDLGALGGPHANSAVAWPVKATNGVIVGISETADNQLASDTFSCWPFFAPGAPTGKACNGFRWEQGIMTALPPFPGGFNSYAAAANNRGQIVGWAENGTVDPTCTPGSQVLQFRAVLWERDGRMQELPPLPGDSTSAADAINDLGQVVGISGSCEIAVGDMSAAHAVIWNNGVPTDIGNLGGHAWNTPAAINNHGTVVGFSLRAGQDGTRNFQAFVWSKTRGMQALPMAADDIRSEALGVNDKDQIVGLSRGPSGIRAVLWHDGALTELNSVTAPGSPFLLYANDINDAGEIAGEAFDAATGAAPAYVAVPQPGNSSNAPRQDARAPRFSPERLNTIERRASPLSIDPRE